MRFRTSVAIVAVAVAGTAIGAFALTNAREPVEASLSMEEARAIALRQAGGGTIADAELEREGDLSIYSFEIRRDDGSLVEVEVNAMTGAVLDDTEESGEDDGEDGDDEPGTDPKAGRGSR